MLDSLIVQCRTAASSDEPIVAVRGAVEELVAQAADLAQAHPAPADCAAISGQTDYLFEDDTVTVCLVHTPPGVQQPPHDHNMPAIIGGYIGVELHRLYRRTSAASAAQPSAPLALSTNTSVGPGDVLTIGTAGVHAIDAAPGTWSSAVHVYLGALSSVERSVFHPDTFEEQPLTMDRYDDWCRPTSD